MADPPQGDKIADRAAAIARAHEDALAWSNRMAMAGDAFDQQLIRSIWAGLLSELRRPVPRSKRAGARTRSRLKKAIARRPSKLPIELPVRDLPALLRMADTLPELLSDDAIIRVSSEFSEEVVELGPDTDHTRKLSAWFLTWVLPRVVRRIPAGERVPDRIWQVTATLHLPDLSSPAHADTLSGSIYLGNESIHEPVESAVKDWLASGGFTIEERDRPVVGSWFRSLRIGVRQAVRSGVAQDAALTAVHAADTRFVLFQDAQTTALMLQNLGPVVAALQPTKDAVIRAGALLIVKADWTVHVFQLTAAQQATLDHRPRLASSPEEIIAALQLTEDVAPHLSQESKANDPPTVW